MEEFYPDALFLIAMELDLPDLLQFCGSSSRFNKIICQQEPIWRYKLNQDYPNYLDFNFNKSLREIYNSLYRIDQLKQKLNINLSLLDIYNLDTLEIDGDVTEIDILPSEIGELVNLRRLWLPNNNLYKLPSELSQLTNLEDLILDNNNFTEFPLVLTEMPQLTFISIFRNRLETLPHEICNLVNLEEFNIGANFFNTLPPEIGNLVNLVIFNISANNYLRTLPLEMTNLTNLRRLYAYDCYSLSIPPEIEQMVHLDILKN